LLTRSSGSLPPQPSRLMPDSIRQSPDGLQQLEELAGIWNGFDLHAVASDVFDEYEPQALESANYIPFKAHCEKLLEAAAARGS
jgi:hypothetical protein